jgi:hypothetical protein
MRISIRFACGSRVVSEKIEETKRAVISGNLHNQRNLRQRKLSHHKSDLNIRK